MKELKIIEIVLPSFERSQIHKVSGIWLDAGPFYYVPVGVELLGHLYKKGYLTPKEYEIVENANGMFIYFTEMRMPNDC